MKLSPTQLETLRKIAEGDGEIHRWRGGFWAPSHLVDVPDIGFEASKVHWWVEIRTIRALERLGMLERTNMIDEEWRDTRQITDDGKAAAGSVGHA